MQIERIGIAGFGAMGSGIAQVVVGAGYGVTAWDMDETSLTHTIKETSTPRTGIMGYWGRIILPAGKAVVPIEVPGRTQAEAVSNAAGLASSLLKSPLLQAALPPGSGAAIEAIKMVGKYATKGKLKKGLKLLKGKGAKRVKKVLKKLKFW